MRFGASAIAICLVLVELVATPAWAQSIDLSSDMSREQLLEVQSRLTKIEDVACAPEGLGHKAWDWVLYLNSIAQDTMPVVPLIQTGLQKISGNDAAVQAKEEAAGGAARLYVGQALGGQQTTSLLAMSILLEALLAFGATHDSVPMVGFNSKGQTSFGFAYVPNGKSFAGTGIPDGVLGLIYSSYTNTRLLGAEMAQEKETKASTCEQTKQMLQELRLRL